MSFAYLLQVKLRISNLGVDTKDYEANPVWELLETTWEVMEDDESYVTISFKLRRHPSYFMMNVFMPVLVLLFLNLLVFVLPCECGEKNSYAVTIFLSFAIFLTIVSATLPENADSVSYFQIFLFGLILESTLITVISILLTRLVSFSEDDVAIPGLLITLSRLVRFNACCITRRHTGKGRQLYAVSAEEGTRQTGGNIKTEEENQPETRDIEDKDSWRTVVNGIDALCLVVFSVFSVLYTILYSVACPIPANSM